MDKAQSVWLSFFWDFSKMAIFFDELQARRYAASNDMEVVNVPTGEDIREFLRRGGRWDEIT